MRVRPSRAGCATAARGYARAPALPKGIVPEARDVRGFPAVLLASWPGVGEEDGSAFAGPASGNRPPPRRRCEHLPRDGAPWKPPRRPHTRARAERAAARHHRRSPSGHRTPEHRGQGGRFPGPAPWMISRGITAQTRDHDSSDPGCNAALQRPADLRPRGAPPGCNAALQRPTDPRPRGALRHDDITGVRLGYVASRRALRRRGDRRGPPRARTPVSPIATGSQWAATVVLAAPAFEGAPPRPPAPWWRGTVPSRWCGQVARIADVAAERGGDTRRSERSRRTRESQRKGLWSARPRRAKSPETRPSPGKVSPRHSRVGLPWRPSLGEHYPWGADTAPPPRDPPREPASPWVARAMRARATSHRGRTGRRGRRSRGARLRQTPAETAMEMWPRPNAGAKEARGRGRASCREREDPHGGMASERCAPA